jgi:hypothetical protein
MYRKPHRETPIERIFREVMGRKMPPSIKRILLPKRRVKRKGHKPPKLPDKDN